VTRTSAGNGNKPCLVELTYNTVELVGAIVPIGLIKMFFGQLDIH
jgi:hypothetical protein